MFAYNEEVRLFEGAPLTCECLRVITCNALAKRQISGMKVPRPKSNRTGVPFTIYLDPELKKRLNTTSKERLVDKSAIVRLAIERFLAQLDSGQLELPLGL
jgi:Ribbon-helix-helix domain